MMRQNAVSLFLLLLSAILPACGQQQAEAVPSVEIPDAYTRSADSLALYIDTRYQGDEAKLQALYIWMTTHMAYNVYPSYESKEEERDDALSVRRTLQKREGVCRHFAKVFQAVGDKMDIPVYVVEGYNKSSNGGLMNALHAWCASKINGKWYCYDPTFGMGYTMSRKFVSRPTMKYCRMEPEVSIRTHMPIDPIWQLLEHPLSYQAFDDGVADPVASAKPCHFNDSICAYLRQSPLQRLLAISRRVTNNGRSNRLIDYFMEVNTVNINVYRQREVYNVFKVALKQYNRSSDCYNSLVRYKLNNFKPKKTSDEIRSLLEEASAQVQAADSTIHSVTIAASSPYAMAVNNLKGTIEELKERLPLLQELLEEQLDVNNKGRRRKG